MVMLFEKSVVSPVFIGRASSLDFLERAFEEVGSGQRQRIVLVSGEAGIGKTRLVAEAKARLGTERVRFLQGSCLEQDRMLPLAPFVGLLQSLLLGTERDDHLVQLAPFAPELVKMLPDLTLWLPEVDPTTALEPEQEKRRLFSALSGFLLGFCRQHPVVLILEDVHWSDEVSLDYLLFLSHQVGRYPLLLVLTYRDTEAYASLRRLLVTLNRERAAVECMLAPLSKEETHALVRAIFQMKRPVQRTFLEMLYELTEGNPFFVEEVLKALLTSGDIFFKDGLWDRKPLKALHVPRSIADAVQQRLDVLSEEARELLALAAVFGRQVEFSLLQALMQRPPDELLSLVEAAIAAQLLVETVDGQLAFRHALTRQAVYTRLLALRRRSLHLRIAQTIEGQGGQASEAHLSDLASHFYQAEAWPQALEYGRRSGEKALAHYSPQAAVEHFTHALEAAAHLPETRLAHMYRLRGQAHEHLGNLEAAQRDFEQALHAVRAVQDREMEWHILMALAFLWTQRDYPRADDYLQHALELAQALDDTQKYAFVQNLRGYWLTNAGQPLAAIALHEEALATSQERSEVQSMGSTLQYLALALMYSGDLRGADAYNDRAIALAHVRNDKRSLLNCLTLRIALASPILCETTLSTREPLAKRREEMQEMLALADSIELRTGRLAGYYTASLACSSSGLLSQGQIYARAGLAGATELGDVQWTAACSYALGYASLLLLAPLEALLALEEALALAQQRGSVFWIGVIQAALARLSLLRGDLAAAEAILGQAFSPDQRPSNLQERCLLLVWSELALARHQPQQALHIANTLMGSVPGESPGSPIPTLWKLRAEALYALGQVEEAVRMLEEAAAEAQAQGALPLLWQIQCSLGRFYLATRQRRAAHQSLAAACETITHLAACLDDEQQRTRFSQAALATLPKQPPPTPRQAAKEAFGGLSAREREVALLITEGKTNREIAAALNISRSTTATHIGHIYDRLGISTRAQLAAWMIEQTGRQSSLIERLEQ